MTHIYKVSGMTCTGCQAKVQKLLSSVEGVKDVLIDLQKGDAAIHMTAPVPVARLKTALKDYPKYQLEEKNGGDHFGTSQTEELAKSWLDTYKPILIVFAYIAGVTILIEIIRGDFNVETWMQNFMAAFFLVFSFFKLLDIRGFAESYAAYDVIAKKWNGWGYLYAFIELGLGISFLLKFNPLLTNAITFVIMTISIIGVLQSLLNKEKIKCACLGAVFNLPMSTITILEDGIMIAMSLVTFIMLLR